MYKCARLPKRAGKENKKTECAGSPTDSTDLVEEVKETFSALNDATYAIRTTQIMKLGDLVENSRSLQQRLRLIWKNPPLNVWRIWLKRTRRRTNLKQILLNVRGGYIWVAWRLKSTSMHHRRHRTSCGAPIGLQKIWTRTCLRMSVCLNIYETARAGIHQCL